MDIIEKLYDIARDAEDDNCGCEAVVIRAAAVFVEHEPWKIMPTTALMILHRGADVISAAGYVARALNELAESAAADLCPPATG